MVSVKVNAQVFFNRLQQYAAITGKAIGDVIRDEIRLTAQYLLDKTPPKKRLIGEKKIKRDIAKVFIKNEYFTEKIKWRNEKYGKRVEEYVNTKNETKLEDMFSDSKFSRIRIEPFSEDTYKKLRDRTKKIPKGVKATSFPLKDGAAVKRLQKKQIETIGKAKAGWNQVLKKLSGKPVAWLSKHTKYGYVKEDLKDKNNPNIKIVNNVPYAAVLDGMLGITKRALMGREESVKAKLELAKRGKWK